MPLPSLIFERPGCPLSRQDRTCRRRRPEYHRTEYDGRSALRQGQCRDAPHLRSSHWPPRALSSFGFRSGFQLHFGRSTWRSGKEPFSPTFSVVKSRSLPEATRRTVVNASRKLQSVDLCLRRGGKRPGTTGFTRRACGDALRLRGANANPVDFGEGRGGLRPAAPGRLTGTITGRSAGGAIDQRRAMVLRADRVNGILTVT